MSPKIKDTTLVLARRAHPISGQMQYAAKVIKASEQLLGSDQQVALKKFFTEFNESRWGTLEVANATARELIKKGGIEFGTMRIGLETSGAVRLLEEACF